MTQTGTNAATGNRSALVLQNNGTGSAFEYNLIGNNAAGAATSYIRQDGSSYFAGNVGIGTTAPAQSLDVAGVARSQGVNIASGYSTLNVENAPLSLKRQGGAANAGISFYDSTNTSVSRVNALSLGGITISDGSNATEWMRINSLGNVGIGTTSPRGTLDVTGAILNATVSNATATIDYSKANLQSTSLSCGALQLNNMKEGGSYTLAVQGAVSGTCAFTIYSDAGVTQYAGANVHYPTDHAASITGKHTLYTFLVLGGHVYITWIPGL